MTLRSAPLAFALMTAGACAPRDPVTALLGALEEAAEDRDADAIRERLAEDFRGADGVDRAEAHAMARRYLAGYESVSLEIYDVSVTPTDGATQVRARVDFTGSARRLPGLDGLRVNVHLWGECISGAMPEEEFVAELEKAGFFGVAVLKKAFWKEVEGYNFSSVTVRGHKFQKKAGCVFLGHRAVYLGPYVAVTDEEGHLFPRGQAIEVCTDTVAKLSHPPYQGSFALVEPGVDAPAAFAAGCGPGCC